MRAVRAAAVLASGLLALGMAQAPSTAATGAHSDGSPGPAGLRDVVAGLDREATFAGDEASPRRVDVVTDPRGDADGPGGAGRRARPYTRLADLTRVRYKTPSRVDGDLRITTRWADLVDGSRPGVRRQTQVTIVYGRTNRHLWAVEVDNASDRVGVVRIGRERNTRVRPEKVSVERGFGPGGTTDVVLSAEWIDTRRVGMYTYAYSGEIKAMDRTDYSRRLTVGPVDRSR